PCARPSSTGSTTPSRGSVRDADERRQESLDMRSTIPPEIPVVDLGPVAPGDEAAARDVAAAVDRACRDLGFIVVVGHGVAQEVIDAAHRTSRAFFDLDLAVRERYQAPPGGFVGYRGLGAEG